MRTASAVIQGTCLPAALLLAPSPDHFPTCCPPKRQLKPESSLPSSPNNQTVHLPSTSDLADSSARPVLSHAGSSASDGSNPPAPLEIRIEAVPHPDREGRPTHRPAPTTKGKPSSIKFAPLPDPRAHTRSLSTGSNVRLAAKLGPGGERTEELQTSGGSESSFRRRRESEDSGLLDGIGDVDDGAAHGLDDMSDDDDDDQAPSKRRSSILGSSWSKGTMKLFGVKSSSSSKNLGRTSSIESNSSGLSGPTSDLHKTFSNLTRTLSPSVSRSSNHSTESAADRQARLLASLSPDKARAASRESTTRTRRQSATSGTLDVPPSSSSFNSLSSSPVNSPRSLVGARMLNGRAYGVKGGVEAIRKAEEEARRGPEFSEWGSVGSMGSNSVNREEEDDGSGTCLSSAFCEPSTDGQQSLTLSLTSLGFCSLYRHELGSQASRGKGKGSRRTSSCRRSSNSRLGRPLAVVVVR